MVSNHAWVAWGIPLFDRESEKAPTFLWPPGSQTNPHTRSQGVASACGSSPHFSTAAFPGSQATLSKSVAGVLTLQFATKVPSPPSKNSLQLAPSSHLAEGIHIMFLWQSPSQ